MDGKWKLENLAIDNSRGEFHYRPDNDPLEAEVNITIKVFDSDTLARIKLRWEG
jgi:hypothetical protein